MTRKQFDPPEDFISNASVTEWRPELLHPPCEPSAWGFIIKVLAVLLILGLVAYKLWEWFVVPAFNAPHLTWFQVFCITLIISLYTPKRYVKGEKPDTSGLMIGIIVGPALILLIGYIAHHYAS